MALNFPNSPTNGQVYTDDVSGNRWTWDSANTCWKSTSTFTQTITVASSAPGSPVAGQLWWNKDYGRLLVYYTDDNTSQWVDASPSDYTSQLAYNKANTALQNTSGTFAGNLGVTGNVGIGSNTTPSEILTVINSNAYAIGLYRDLDYNSVGAMGTIINFGGRVGSTRTESSRITGVLENTTSGSLAFSALVSGSMVDKLKLKYTGEAYFPYGQIQFPATQNASSDANTLDDYEEGSWTPIIGGNISDPTYTASQAAGVYIKLGRLVHISALIIVSGVSAQGSGGILLRGLPFSYGGTTYASQLMIGYNDVWDTAFTNFYLYGGSTNAYLSPTGVTQSNAQYGATSGSASNLSTGYFGISGSYYASA